MYMNPFQTALIEQSDLGSYCLQLISYKVCQQMRKQTTFVKNGGNRIKI